MRSLPRFRRAVQIVNAIVLPGERHRVVTEARLHHHHRFLQTIDAHAGRIEWQADHLVLRREPTRADSPVDATIRKEVEGRELLGVHDRMAVVVAGDERADPQRRGGIDRGGERRDQRQLRTKVIGHEQIRAADRFDPLAERAPLVAIGDELTRHPETERARRESTTSNIGPDRRHRGHDRATIVSPICRRPGALKTYASAI